ncbi:16S rRNA (cytosine(1402)-N(4))-methyltransferase RsmH [Buchnera aphidicola]|nr:16S rRNA (cytosine(1402)-N(4))-methyltransferase RsmH [Buchnera aphidicola]
MNKKIHETVLLNESINSLKIKKNGIYFDGTFGCGGHSKEILKKLGKHGKLYAIDRDPQSIEIGKKISDPRFYIIHGNFSNIDILLKKYNLKNKIDGMILDLGISSLQIMSKKRGFSFYLDGPLDMRMNPNDKISAFKWINSSNTKDIYYVLKNFGEERFAKKIAHKISIIKKKKLISTTKELSQIIESIVPRKNKHPATKSFQAIRIFINKELDELNIFLKKSLNFLNHKGKISIISFHSLEDRIVKRFINKYNKIPNIPVGLPISENQIKKMYNIKFKNIHRIFPSLKEIKKNIKSRSAILRTATFKSQNIKK